MRQQRSSWCFAITVAVLIGGFLSTPAGTVSAGFRADSSRIHASLELESEWLGVEVRFAQATSDGTAPDLSVSARSLGDAFRFHAHLCGLLDTPRLSAGLAFHSGTLSLSSDVEAGLFSRTPSFLRHASASLSLTLVEELTVSGRIRVNDAGMEPGFSMGYSSPDLSLQVSQDWTSEGTPHTAYEMRCPPIRLGLRHAVTGGWLGSRSSTDWIALSPSIPSPSAEASPTLWATADGRARDSKGEIHFEFPASRVIDFGETPVDDSATRTYRIKCPCTVSASCRYDAWRLLVIAAPGEGFRVEVSSTAFVALESSHDVTLVFTPTRSGPFVETVVLACEMGFQPDPSTLEDVEFPGEEPGFEDDIYRRSDREVVLRLVGFGVSAPEAVPAHLPDPPKAGQTVTFSADGSFDTNEGGRITAWSWTFSDGTSSSEPNPTKSYPFQGEYTAWLVVWNEYGVPSERREIRIEVKPDPARVFVPLLVAGATYSLLTSPPLLLPAAPGYAEPIAVNEIMRHTDQPYVSGQLIVYAPESATRRSAERAIRKAMPEVELVGYSSPLKAHLVEVPPYSETRLAVWQSQLATRLPSGYRVRLNRVGVVEGSDFKGFYSAYGKVYETILADPGMRTVEYLVQSASLDLDPVCVAVVDTGVFADHNEFQEAEHPVEFSGHSYVKCSEEEQLVHWASDDHGHGTCVAGLIASPDGNAGSIGLASAVCSALEMQILQVNADAFCAFDCFRAASAGTLRYYTDEERKARPNLGFKNVVVNISMGWEDSPLVAGDFMDLFKEYENVLFVCSAGNEGRELLGSGSEHCPGGIKADNCLTVAAVDPEGKGLMEDSNHGYGIQIAAPGDFLYAPDNVPNEYDEHTHTTEAEGTSFATALVTGAAAVVRSIAPTLPPKKVIEILTAVPEESYVDNPGGDRIPVLNLQNAVALAVKEQDEAKKGAIGEAIRAGGYTYLIQVFLGVFF